MWSRIMSLGKTLEQPKEVVRYIRTNFPLVCLKINT
jgi:hypothetical protein